MLIDCPPEGYIALSTGEHIKYVGNLPISKENILIGRNAQVWMLDENGMPTLFITSDYGDIDQYENEVFAIDLWSTYDVANTKGREFPGDVNVTITVEFTPQEQKALLELATQKDLSEASVIRQALRLYQLASISGGLEALQQPPAGCMGDE